MEKIKSQFRQQFLATSISVVTWRLVLFLVSALASIFFAYKPSFPYSQTLLKASGLPQWIYAWANFDGVHYLTIIQKGYVGTGLIQAFFPLYPGFIKALTVVGFEMITAGLLVSFVSLLSVGFIWKNWVSQVHSPKIASISWLTLLLFPTAFFFGALYTESLFLFLVVASFWAASRKQWWLAGMIAAFASNTRVVGVFLVPALMLELWQQEHQKLTSFLKAKHWLNFLKKKWLQLIAISIGSLGLFGYMFYLHLTFDDPLFFLHVQSEFGGGRQESLITYPQVIWRYLKILVTVRPLVSWSYLGIVQEFVAGTLGLVLIAWTARKARWGVTLFSLLAFILPTLTGTFSSMPRYILVLPSIFLGFAFLLEKQAWVRWAFLIGSTGLLLLNTILFLQGYWVA